MMPRYEPENETKTPIDPRQPARYEIRLQGHLGTQWNGWFQDLQITRSDDGETQLTGTIVDQAALYGLLRKVRDLGMPLIAVTHLGPAHTDTGEMP